MEQEQRLTLWLRSVPQGTGLQKHVEHNGLCLILFSFTIYFSLKKIFWNFCILTNNIISVKVAKALQYLSKILLMLLWVWICPCEIEMESLLSKVLSRIRNKKVGWLVWTFMYCFFFWFFWGEFSFHNSILDSIQSNSNNLNQIEYNCPKKN